MSHRSPRGEPLALARRAAHLELDACSQSTQVTLVGPAALTSSAADQSTFEVAAPYVDLTQRHSTEIFLATSADSADRLPVARIVSASSSEVVAVVNGTVEDGESHGMNLYAKFDPTVVPRALTRFLDELPSAGLAAVLQDGRKLKKGEACGPTELNSDQRLAVGSIIADGVTAIWGPPGTGKTRVISEAIAHLYQHGKSVALVSNTNVAVDQALLQVSAALGTTDPGQVLRIGHPTLPRVAKHPTLTVTNAVLKSETALTSQKDQLSAEIERLRGLPFKDDHLLRAVGDRSVPELNELLAKHRDHQRAPKVALRRDHAVDRVAWSERHRDSCARDVEQARQRVEALKPFDYLIDMDRTAHDAREQLESTESETARLGHQQSVLQTGSFFTRRWRQKESMAIETRIRDFDEEATATARRLSAAEKSISDAAASGVSPGGIRFAHAANLKAEELLEKAKAAVALAEPHRKSAETELARISAIPALSDDEVALAKLLEAEGSAHALTPRIAQARSVLESRDQSIQELAAKIKSIQKKLAKLEEEIVRKAPVVGTTLAQLVLHPALRDRSFDFVVIDEASAVLPPFAFAALAKANSGAAVVGDPEQNSPISAIDSRAWSTMPEDDLADLKPWLSDDPLAMLGVGSTTRAKSHDGCVALHRQYRFGDLTMEIANSVAYGGLLKHGRSLSPRSADDPELVIVDTSSLRNAARAEHGLQGKGRWWAAGAAVSSAIAKLHEPQDIGVITPYRAQSQLTKSHMRDCRLSVEVGTSHAFQGREFPAVILDLVEDGTGSSWIAQACRGANEWKRDGVRVFNVAATRNAGRLYVVGSFGPRHGSATSGSQLHERPLAALHRLREAPGVEVWDARELLEGTSLANMPDPAASPILLELSNESVLLDETTFYPYLADDISRAQHRVAIFSPFVSEWRTERLLSALLAAVARGVRVTAFTKTQDELRDTSPLRLLTNAGVKVKELRDMHEKVVIIDESVSYVGSLNVLSNNGQTGEVMMRLPGSEITAEIAKFMKSAIKRRR